jgi:hypothetical protein
VQRPAHRILAVLPATATASPKVAAGVLKRALELAGDLQNGNPIILELAPVPSDFSDRRIRRDSPWQAGARISHFSATKGLFVIRAAVLAAVPKWVVKW